MIERYTADSSHEDVADVSSGKLLLEFNQPYANHNGGELAFDKSGYLPIATGDGGSGGDPKGNGQNLKALLGKILRTIVINRLLPCHYGSIIRWKETEPPSPADMFTADRTFRHCGEVMCLPISSTAGFGRSATMA